MAHTTIQISLINNDLLNQVAAVMEELHPQLWGDQPPTRNAIVGFLASAFLSATEATP